MKWFVFLSVLASFAWAAEPAEMLVRNSLISDLLILFGCIFILAAGIGVYRFPDFYIRLHASSKLITLGGIGIFGGAAIAFVPVAVSERLVLVALFFFLTAPLSGYMIARAGYLRGIRPYQEEGSKDEWQARGAATNEQ